MPNPRPSPLAVFLGGSPRPVEVNAIIGEANPAETEVLATKAVEEGFRTLKLKVGGRDLEIDEDALTRTRNAVGNAIKLRLDANQAWPEHQASLALDRLAKFSPEFIEEPVTPSDIPTLSRLHRKSPIPIAADESVENAQSAATLAESGAVDILVIKLARVGGITAARSIIEHAQARGLGAVLTSSLETGVGLAAALHLAAAMSIPPSLRPCHWAPTHPRPPTDAHFSGQRLPHHPRLPRPRHLPRPRCYPTLCPRASRASPAVDPL